jgi:hypothetical protein
LRRVVLIGAGLVIGVLAIALLVTRSMNRRARERVTNACARLHANQGRVLEKMKPVVAMMADEPDRPAIVALLARQPFADVCAKLTAELGDYRWNFGRRVDSPPSSDADRARVSAAREAMMRSAPRCRGVLDQYAKSLEAFGPVPEEDRSRLLSLCDFDKIEWTKSLRLTRDTPPRLLDEWPELLEGWADATERL